MLSSRQHRWGISREPLSLTSRFRRNGARIRTGRNTDESTEVPVQMTLIVEAARESNKNRARPGFEELSCMRDSAGHDVFVGCHAKLAPKCAHKARPGQSRYAGQMCERDCLKGVFLDEFPRAPGSTGSVRRG